MHSEAQMPSSGTEREPQRNPSNGSTDEIDLLEVFVFIWRIRKWIVLGAVLGSVIGVALVLSGPIRYQTRIPVGISPLGLPATTESTKVVENFRTALGSPDLLDVFFRTLVDRAPGLKAELEQQKIGVAALVLEQITSTKENDRSARVLPGSAMWDDKLSPVAATVAGGPSMSFDFVVETSLAVKGLGAEGGEAVVAAFNALATASNERTKRTNDVFMQASLNSIERAFAESQGNLSSARIAREKEAADLRRRLARLEYQLMKRAQGAAIRFTDFFVTTSPEKLTDDSKRMQRNPEVLDIDRVVRLMALLQEENRIGEDEIERIQSQIADIRKRNSDGESRFSGIGSANTMISEQLAKARTATIVPLDRGLYFLPTFTSNRLVEDFSKTLGQKNGGFMSFEKKVSRGGGMVKVVALTVIGGILGALIAGGVLLVRRNRFRILALLKTPQE